MFISAFNYKKNESFKRICQWRKNLRGRIQYRAFEKHIIKHPTEALIESCDCKRGTLTNNRQMYKNAKVIILCNWFVHVTEQDNRQKDNTAQRRQQYVNSINKVKWI